MDREIPLPNIFYGGSSLHVAVRSGQVEDVRKVLDQQLVNVNCLNSKHETPLHLACSLRHKDIVVLLIAFGADPYIKNSDGNIAYRSDSGVIPDLMNKMLHHNNLWINGPDNTNGTGDTLLHTAVRQGDLANAQRLILKQNSLVNDINASYETPLHLACALGHEPIVHLLVANGANMYKRDCYNNAPIHRAVAKGHVEVASLLIATFSCDPKALTGYQGRTLLHFASAVGNIEFITTAIEEYEISPLASDAIGKSPLHIAACHGQEEVVSLLITKYNSPVDCRSSYNLTPLHLACYCGDISCIKRLICAHKADLSLCDDDGDIPLHKACFEGHINVVKMLVREQKADLSAHDYRKNTPMHVATLAGHKDIVETLINEFQCNPHEKGNNGRSLLHYACDKGHTKLAVMLITEFDLDPCLADDSGDTPLHMACWGGHEELARLLITKYNCPIGVRNKQNETPLHKACVGGHINVVKTLVTEFVVDLNERDNQNDTPLSKAALCGHTDLVRMLIEKCKCNPQDKGFAGRSLLHCACDNGHTKLAVMLITEFKLDPCLADDSGNTPLHMACWGTRGPEELARLLVTKYNSSVDVKNKHKETPLHKACGSGHINVVKMLVREYKADLSARDHQWTTPMHKAALGGHKDIVESLINEFQCNPHEKGCDGMSLLHYACEKGHTKLAVMLITEFQLDPCLADDSGNTPLHMACLCGHEELAGLLITTYNCPVDVKNEQNETPLHEACVGGHINVVKMLIKEYKADLSARNHENSTPMHKAALGGHKDIVESLINEFQCNPHEMGYDGRSLLHYACDKGHTKLAVMLITEYELDPCLADDSGNTPLHMACRGGHEELARLLITKYNCPVDVKNIDGDQPIHFAAIGGHPNIVSDMILDYGCDANPRGSGNMSLLHLVMSKGFTALAKTLIEGFQVSIHCTDDNGNTPLHVSSLYWQPGSVIQLLYDYHAPIFVRNKAGKTALQLCRDDTVKRVFKEYMQSENCKIVQKEYEELHSLSLQKYPGKQRITRVFVLGNAESGKSTLVESLKRKGVISSRRPISVFDVPPHTAGIIPSFYESRLGRRFLYYDFAGDTEYYSSHSAILKIVSQSSVGASVFIVVGNLTKDLTVLYNEMGYWMSFISYHVQNIHSQCKHRVIIVLSHSDMLIPADVKSKIESIKHYIQRHQKVDHNSINVLDVDMVSFDCRKPRSSKIVKEKLQKIASEIHPCTLSFKSTLLLGLLEKDFRNVIACKLQDLLLHIKETGVFLPTTAVELHPIVKELHDIGLLMMIEADNKDVENSLIMLDLCTLTNDVHEKLFSKTAAQNFSPCVSSNYVNMGIIPESCLHDILPEHITKECLVHLQYCQEFTHAEVVPDYSILPDSSSNENLLYFPGLCCLEKEQNAWQAQSRLTFHTGWYSGCIKELDYFPSRFTHVMLLKLAFSLALPVTGQDHISDSSVAHAYSRRCTMWKNGIRWLMEEGVECIVEIVDDNKGLVAIAKAEECSDEPFAILGKIVSIAMKAKGEICDIVPVQHFLMDSDNPQSFEDKDKLFEINDIERVIKEGKKKVVSVSGRNFLDSSHFVILKKFAYWGKINWLPLPVEFFNVACY